MSLPESDPLLPGWFSDRMMNDIWSFGLLTVTGHTICIECIDKVWQAANGDVWIDATFLNQYSHTRGDLIKIGVPNPILPPVDRHTLSINTRNIVAAFEISDT